MDWHRVGHELAHLQTLSADQAAHYLQALTQATPDIADAVTRLSGGGGFLDTHAPGAPSLPPLTDGTKLGAWRINHRIQTGGMGDVYRVHRDDGLYDQIAALKVLKSRDDMSVQRFEAERQRLARLDHPGIARIIDGGTTDDGRPYLVMEFIDGLTIDAFILERSLSTKACVQLLAKLCDAVSHAHNKLILHRDIKPANVLVASDGIPRLIDFGIGGDLEHGARATGGLTFTYAAPEQLLGQADSVGTDIFGLGALLYTTLTGAPPPRRPDGGVSTAHNALSEDMRAILAKATAFSPDMRYNSVGALADDLRAHLSRRPVAARGADRLYQFGRFFQRHTVPSALGAALLLALTGGLISSAYLANKAEAEAARAIEALDRARFNLRKSDASLLAQNAYADAMLRAFGGEDVERQTETLLERWEEAYAQRAVDPANAAALSYALGRHFFFRDDYQTAAKILEPWMTERYGPAELLGLGELYWPFVLRSLGRNEESLTATREVVKHLGESYDANTLEHFNYAVKLALDTEDPGDLAVAEGILEKLRTQEFDGYITMYLHSQESQLRYKREDFDGALHAAEKAVATIAAHPLIDIAGRDIARMNLADAAWFHQQDLAKATDMVDTVLREADAGAGRNIVYGRALAMKALLASHSSDHDDALRLIDEALPVIDQYGGTKSPNYIKAMSIRALIFTAAGHNDKAEKSLADAAIPLTDVPLSDKRRQMLLLTRLALFPLEGAPASSELNLSMARKDVYMRYLLDQTERPPGLADGSALSR